MSSGQRGQAPPGRTTTNLKQLAKRMTTGSVPKAGLKPELVSTYNLPWARLQEWLTGKFPKQTYPELTFKENKVRRGFHTSDRRGAGSGVLTGGRLSRIVTVS